MTIKYKISSVSLKELYSFLLDCNEYFVPKLSEKVNIKDYSEKLYNNAVNFEAWHNNLIIGLVSMYINNVKDLHSFGYITNVCVRNDFKKKGIAAQLLKFCIEYSHKNKISIIKLEVNKKNYNAIKLYKSLNFKTDEEKGDSKFMSIELNTKGNNV